MFHAVRSLKRLWDQCFLLRRVEILNDGASDHRSYEHYLSSNENKVHNTGNWHLKAMEIQQSFTCISYSLPEELGGIVVTDGVEFVVTWLGNEV